MTVTTPTTPAPAPAEQCEDLEADRIEAECEANRARMREYWRELREAHIDEYEAARAAGEAREQRRKRGDA